MPFSTVTNVSLDMNIQPELVPYYKQNESKEEEQTELIQGQAHQSLTEILLWFDSVLPCCSHVREAACEPQPVTCFFNNYCPQIAAIVNKHLQVATRTVPPQHTPFKWQPSTENSQERLQQANG